MIKAHWNYFKYVMRHKWYVFQECRKLKISLWGAIIHDWQKFTPSEWKPYVLSFYGPWEYKERPEWLVEAFNHAWLHHIHYGPHHWQYWLLQEDNGELIALEMPERYRREMLADWRGASRAITGQDNTRDWYQKRKGIINLHSSTRWWIETDLNLCSDKAK